MSSFFHSPMSQCPHPYLRLVTLTCLWTVEQLEETHTGNGRSRSQTKSKQMRTRRFKPGTRCNSLKPFKYHLLCLGKRNINLLLHFMHGNTAVRQHQDPGTHHEIWYIVHPIQALEMQGLNSQMYKYHADKGLSLET